MFVLDLSFNASKSAYRRRHADGYNLHHRYSFIRHFSQPNRLRMKNYMINIVVLDEFTGTVRYDCEAKELPAGVRTKLRELVTLPTYHSRLLDRRQVHTSEPSRGQKSSGQKQGRRCADPNSA
jgi:hypothetical protein